MGRDKEFRKQLITIAILSILVLYTISYAMMLLQTELSIQAMEQAETDYDAYRQMKVTETALFKAKERILRVIDKQPYLKELPYMNTIGYLTYSMLAGDYDLVENSLVKEYHFRRGIGRVASLESFQTLYEYNQAIFTDLKYFPIPYDISGEADIYYEDSWLGPRTYGGDRKHEGTDLMATNNQRGYFPVLSITDGVVEKKGWLEQGGYRIGIRSEAGGYFYYAHLSSYAPELKEGDRVIAGQLLGFMGDSGYGKEGTIGQFAVHLHMGIYVDTPAGEMSVNPYHIMKILEKNRISMDIK